MNKILIVVLCLLLGCVVSSPVYNGTVHHFKSIDTVNTRYYILIGTAGIGCELLQYASFVDRVGKYAVGDTVIYMTESEY